LIRLLRWAGHLLSVASLAYVFWIVAAELGGVRTDLAATELLARGALASLIYVAAATLLGVAWYFLLRLGGAGVVSLRTAWHMHGLSQLAKYLPGNVFHLAGRHHLGRQAGAGHRALLVATALEAASLLAVASLLVILFARGTLVDLPPLGRVDGRWLAAVLLASVLAAMAWRLRRQGWRAARDAAAAWACLASFFVLVGAAGVLLLSEIVPSTSWGWFPAFVGAYALAWSLGFLVPGAPGGLGVREAVLVGLLGPSAGLGELALFALLFRVVSMVGDVGYFALAALLRPGRGTEESRPAP
jgi:hypothetical protein